MSEHPGSTPDEQAKPAVKSRKFNVSLVWIVPEGNAGRRRRYVSRKGGASPGTARRMRRATDTLLEAHLMIVQPERYLEAFAQAGADLIIVHQEAVVHLDRAIQQIKQLGKRAGVALCPATPLHTLDEVVEELDMLLVMTVNPGFGGQRFIPYTLRKIAQARALLDARNPACELEIDGGVDLSTIGPAYAAGARVFVAGSSVFGYAQGVETAVGKLQGAARNNT